MTNNDKAGSAYWDENWSKMDFPVLFSHEDGRLDNYVNLQLHEFFKNLLKDKHDFSVLEIGCANSIWPPYFYQYFGAQADGLDYSEVGCEKSRLLLKSYNIPGTIHCADLFAPPEGLKGKYDLVVSFGVVEHFEDTACCLSACAALVKPGGMLVTLVPNMSSLVGAIQKFADKAVYDVHVPLTREMLSQAHKEASLNLEGCLYFMSMNLCVVNSGSFESSRFNQLFRRVLSGISKICWALEKKGIKIPTNRFTSPYIISIAEL